MCEFTRSHVASLALILTSIAEIYAHCETRSQRDKELCCSVRRDPDGYTESRFTCRDGCCGEELQQYCCERQDVTVPLAVGLTLGSLAFLGIVFAIVTCVVRAHGYTWSDVGRLCREGAGVEPSLRRGNERWRVAAMQSQHHPSPQPPEHTLVTSPDATAMNKLSPKSPSTAGAPPSYDEVCG